MSKTVITGFPFHDGDAQGVMPSSVARFLDEGPPPLVFTLGSAVCGYAESFFEHSVRCAQLLNHRAVIIVGRHFRQADGSLPSQVMAARYAPFIELFPRAAAIVHHGGVGTTGLAMRAGRPMLVVPHAWDQPDNAHRVARLGIARTVRKGRYTPDRAAAELRHLLNNPEYSERASRVAEHLRRESGEKTACDALENVL